MKKNIKNDLKKICKNISTDVDMRNYTSLRIGGPADFLLIPENIDELNKILYYAKKNNIYYFVLGRGTNILVSDKGIRGFVIKLSKFNKISIKDNIVNAESGANLSRILNLTRKRQLSGFEFASGIPGSIGGAISTNCGSELGCIGDITKSITVIDNNLNYVELKNIVSNYRETLVDDNNAIIISSSFKMKEEKENKIIEKINYLKEKRKKTQPLHCFSAGCIFKNPKDVSAGYLIDKSCAKGLSVGDAFVSYKHANFIINKGKAKAKDFLSLIEKVREMVFNKFNISLQLEIKIYGEL